MRKYFLLIVLFMLFGFGGTSLKKRISDANWRYEFYTTDKVVTPKSEREYYWFKGGLIHKSEYGTGGELLHKDFYKYYHSNQLAETGQYKCGLKEGYWKTWFENGALQSEVYWSSGQRDGSYYMYDQTGFLVEKGRFKNNKKHGRWINYISKDTLKYRRGELVIKKVKVKDTLSDKPGFFKRLFGSKKEKQGKENQPEVKKSKPADRNDNNTQAAGEGQPKKTFFGRLFSKIGGWFSDKNKQK